jgi:hypothetical protein
MAPMIDRLLLAGVLVAAGPALAFAEASCKFAGSVWVSEEAVRPEVLRKVESNCEIGKLQPLLIEIGLTVLQDIKDLEKRPRGTLEEWAQPLLQLHGNNEGYGRLVERLDRIRGIVRPGPLSDEEEVRQGNVARRLIQLAVTGRVTKHEYDSLMRRLQGN